MRTIFVTLFSLYTVVCSIASAQTENLCSSEISQQNSPNFFSPAIIITENLKSYSGIVVTIRYSGQPKSQIIDLGLERGQGYAFQWNWFNSQTEYDYFIQASASAGTFGLQNPKIFETGWVKSNKKAICLQSALWRGPQAKSIQIALPAFQETGRELLLLRMEDSNCSGIVAGKSVVFKKGQPVEDQIVNYYTCSGLEPAKLSLRFTYYENGNLKRSEISAHQLIGVPKITVSSDLLNP